MTVAVDLQDSPHLYTASAAVRDVMEHIPVRVIGILGLLVASRLDVKTAV